MAYDQKNLSVLAYANGFTLWHYTTTDTSTAVKAAAYFDAAYDMLRKGDMVLANTNTGGTVDADVLLVRDALSSGVTVFDVTS